MFIILLSFSSSLATKCLPLNHKPCMVIPTPIDLNPVKLKYYWFIISLDKCNGSCNVSSPKTRFPKIKKKKKKTKDINFKVSNMSNMKTNKNEAKTIKKHISCDYKWIFSSTTCISDQKCHNETCQCKCKNYQGAKKIK